jgi:exocyst complex component 2
LGAEKVIYHSEKFDPKFFLARIHQNTSAYDLEAAGDALKRDLQNRKEQLKKLVKENFDCFISCKNTIDGEHTGFILHHLMSSY